MTSRFRYHRKVLAVAKVFFDMYNGYTYKIGRSEKDSLTRFHFICAQIDEICARLHIPKRLNLPNGMTVIPSYIPLFRDGYINRVEVEFILTLNGFEIGRIKDIVCAYDSFAIDLGYIIIGSGMPYKDVYEHERATPLCIEIMKMVDLITNITWPAWKGVYPLKRGVSGPLLGWTDDPGYTINGIRRTVDEWSEIMGVHPYLVQRELDDGEDIENALKEAELIHKSKPKNKKPPTHDHGFNPKTYEYKGRVATLNEWARVLDVPPWTLKQRMNRGATFEEAFEMGGTKQICINGEWKYIEEWCRIYGIKRNTVDKLIKEGLKPEDAILTGRMREIQDAKKKERDK